METVARKTPTMTGMRSREAPSPVASASPAVATKDRETLDATITPASDHAARVSSAPNRRNQRNWYTAENALPPGNELAMACVANVIFTSGRGGAFRPPLPRSSYCIPVKQRNEANSTTRAGGSHHQLRCPKTCESGESSSRCDDSAHRPTTSTPIPSKKRNTGHMRWNLRPDGHPR